MFDIHFVTHDQLTEIILLEVIRLKSSAWNYSYEDQVSWINTHIKDSDLHCFLSEDGVNVGYLNLIETNIIVDDLSYRAYGVGNVCSIVRKKGYGSILLNYVNDFIVNKEYIGVLLCKPELSHFYNKSGWKFVPYLKLLCEFSLTNIEMMTYNCEFNYKQIIYKGGPF